MSRIIRACFAGFLGTVVILCMTVFASPTLAGGPADLAFLLALLLGGSWLAGMGMLFAVGTVALPLLYLALVDRRLHGGPAVRGALWGLALWVISQAVLLPVSGGAGLAGQDGGLRLAADSLLGHLAYGLVLGLLAGDPDERAFSLRQEFAPHPQLRRAA